MYSLSEEDEEKDDEFPKKKSKTPSPKSISPPRMSVAKPRREAFTKPRMSLKMKTVSPKASALISKTIAMNKSIMRSKGHARGDRYNITPGECRWPIDRMEKAVSNCDFNLTKLEEYRWGPGAKNKCLVGIMPAGTILYHATTIFPGNKDLLDSSYMDNFER